VDDDARDEAAITAMTMAAAAFVIVKSKSL